MKYVVEYEITHRLTGAKWLGRCFVESERSLSTDFDQMIEDAKAPIRRACNTLPDCPLGPVKILNFRPATPADSQASE